MLDKNRTCYIFNQGDNRIVIIDSILNPPGRGEGGGGVGDSLTFGMGVLMCLFGVGEIIWGLKIRPKSAICCLKFRVGEIIWGVIFLLCHFLVSSFSSKLDSLLIGVFVKMV